MDPTNAISRARRPTRRTLAVLGLGLALSVAAAEAATNKQDFSLIDLGRRLAIAGDCAACHTVPGSGKQMAGGRAIETPFGVLLAPNLTPDRETGIGAWTDDEFIDAMTSGINPGNIHLYPAMPYPYLTKVTRQDALAIRAYLNTLAPVRNPVHSNQLPFPLNQRVVMRAWNALYFSPGVFQSNPGKSAEWNRGAYLVEGLAHCGACHTPKNALGADDASHALQGYPLQGWLAPNITNDARRGVGGWSVDDIVAYLRTGHNRNASATGPMAEMVARSSSQMTDADLQAIAVYLKDLPGQGGETQSPVPLEDPAMISGQAIYRDTCSACHGSDGSGVAGLFPALKGAPAIQSIQPTSLIHAVLRGARSVATDGAPTGPAMPSFQWLMTDEQVAAVTTYIRNAWGNAAPKVTAGDVAHMRQALARRTD